VRNRTEWLKVLGPGFTDRTDEAVEKGLTYVITDGSAPSRKTPKERGG